MAETQSIQAGVQQGWLMFYDVNGDPSGNDTTVLANAESKGSYWFRGIQELPTGLPETDTVPVPGDDTVLGNCSISSDAPREFVVNMGQMDLELEKRLQNTEIEQVAGANVGISDTPDAVLATVSLIVQSKAISNGRAAWSGFIYPLVQLQPLNRETFSGRTAGVVRYKGVAQPAFNRPWGTTIRSRAGSPISAYALPFTSDFPMTMHAFRGSVTSFTLDKTPYSVAYTAAYVDKVALTVSSVNTPTSRLLTLSGASAASRPGFVIYQYV
jgi:hypothetical protein